MGTSREGLTNSNSAEITSSPNQDYFWAFVLGFGCGLFFCFVLFFQQSLPWSQEAQNTLPSTTECITPTSSLRSSI